MTSTHDELRPTTLDEFIGQEDLKKRLRPWIAEAIETERPLTHMLLTSEAGCGKTSLAQVVANEVGDPLEVIDLSRMTDRQFISWVRNTEPGIKLVDEIHRATRKQQENLLTLMWEGYVSTQYGGRIERPWLTILAATTEPWKLLDSVVSRFGQELKYGVYTDEEIATMGEGMARRLNVDVTPGECKELAMAAGGNPRAMSVLVRAWRAISFAETPSVERVLFQANREPDGLTTEHLDYLRMLDKMQGVAGEDRMAKMMRMHPSKIQNLQYLLIIRGFISPSPQGLVLTAAGTRRLKGQESEMPRRRVLAGAGR